MKKLYLLFMAVTAFIATTKAQCPGPNPASATPYITSTGCFVIVSNMLPNAILRVRNAIGDDITLGSASTDNNGSGTAGYNCNSSPAQVVAVIVLPGGGTQSCFALVAPPITLPVRLSSFKAQLKNSGMVSLQWSSEFERESEKFVIQRSLDGVNYTSIGEIASSGFSVSTKRYSFDDAGLGERDAYYRLNMVDIDGKSEMSKSIYVNNRKGNAGSASLKVFPNPFRADLQIVGVSASEVNRRNIKVYTITGKEINYTISGSNAITIDNNAPRGVYLLRVHDKTFKLIKE